MKGEKLLAKAIDVKVNEARELLESGDYIILSDSDADQRVKEYILESVWAFRPEFLAAHAKEGIDVDVFQAIQANNKCEDNNAAILALIEDVDHFVDDAIRCDGRGHFLSSYDGEEIELGNNLFAYRVQ